MTTKQEFSAANEAVMAGDRKRLGEPPSAAEVLAYTRGHLATDEHERIRERLVAYPELVRTLTAPFPTEGAQPGDADYLSDDEFATRWASLQKRRQRPGGARVLQFWRGFSAIAATLAVVFGALFWNARSELTKPRLIADQQVLLPDGRRGGDDDGFVKLTAEGETFVLAASLINEPAFDTYRLEILDPTANPPTTVWSSKPAPRLPDDSVTILVSRTFFRPGKYKLVLYGVSGTREERLSSYSLRVPER